MINKIKILIFFSLIFSKSIHAQDIGVYYLFDVSKSYKQKALNEAIEVSEKIYSVFTSKKNGLGSVSPQYHLTGTIDSNSIKSTKPCTVIYDDNSGGLFNTNKKELPSLSPCLEKIYNLPYSMNTDIRGGVYNAANNISNIDFKALIIFSDMENDPLKSFQNKLSLDNLDGITILILYSHTLASQKSNITDKYVKEFIKLFKNAGASEVRAQTLQSVAVKEQAGASDVVKFFRNSFKKNNK